MLILLKVIGIILLADLVTGIVHWLEDSYWSPETPILGKWLVIPNLAHHQNGQDFLKKTWLESSWDLLLVGLILLAIAYATNHLTWEVWLFVVLTINANQIHKWSHMTRHKPLPIRFLQKIYLLQTTQHHGQHHRKPNNSHYCTMTNWLNPLLDKLQVWRGLERVFGSKNALI